MNKQICLTLKVVSDAILIALAVISVPCAVLTAYELPFQLFPLVIAALGMGFLLSFWMQVPKYGKYAGILFLIIFGSMILLLQKSILYGANIAWYEISGMIAPDVPFLSAPAAAPQGGAGTTRTGAVDALAFLVMVLLGLAVAWSLIRSKMILLPLIVPLPLFMVSLIYTDLPVAHWTIFLLLVYLGTCLLSGALRVYEVERSGLVTCVVLLAMAMLAGIVYMVSPPDQYVPMTMEQRREVLQDRFENLYEDIRSALTNRVKRTEDLTDEDEWSRTDTPVLDVVRSNSGLTYLKAYSLGKYERNAWRMVDAYNGEWQSMAALGKYAERIGVTFDSIYIRAKQSEMFYTPYGFVTGNGTLNESFLPANDVTDYDWSFADVTGTGSVVSDAETAYLAWAKEQYTITDPDVKTAIRAYAESQGLYDTGDPYRTAQMVSDFVRSQGVYNTTPGSMPNGKDFVLYFLQESKQGYCVHFASATAAILQSFDLPARYVYGYRYYADAGQWETVTDESAHAWAEVYEPGVGWLRLESTAGAEGWEEPGANAAPPSAEPTPEPTPEPTSEPEPDSELTEQETPEPTEQPDDAIETNNGDESDEQKDAAGKRRSFWRLLWLLLLPAIAAGMWGADRYMHLYRQKQFRQENAKAAILAMYRYQKRLERHGAPKDEVAEELAEEATFSDHDMTGDRKTMFAVLHRSLRTLSAHPRWKRLVYRWILFLT